MYATLILAFILFAAGLIISVYARLQPKYRILNDVGKLISCQMYDQSVILIKASNKKQLARELKRIMNDAMKNDKKGIVRPGPITQRNRFRFAYELYRLFVGELNVKQDILDGSQLTEEHKYIIETLKQIVGK
jgi:hypothetical protein